RVFESDLAEQAAEQAAALAPGTAVPEEVEVFRAPHIAAFAIVAAIAAREGALGDLHLALARLGLEGRDLLRLLLEAPIGVDRLAHEGDPDLRGQASAGHPLHRLEVVIADPHADHEIAGEADEPGVAIILA